MTIADAQQFLNETQAVLEELPGVVIESLQNSGRLLPRDIQRLFDRERYANEKGRIVKLKNFGPRWGATKSRVKFDSRRGHATKTASRAIGDRRSFGKLREGFVIDIDKTAKRWRADYRKLGRRRRIRVSMYLQHYVDAKAPGFLSLGEKQKANMEQAVAREIVDAFHEIDAAETSRVIMPGLTRQTFEIFISNLGLMDTGIARAI